MKRLSPRNQLILDNPALLVGEERPLFDGDPLPEFFKPLLHDLRRGFRILVMDRHLIKPAIEEFSLHGRRRGIREEACFGLDPEDPQSRLISRDKNIKVQRMFRRPRYQFFRGISPAQAEGRFEDGLRMETPSSQHEVACQHSDADFPGHVAGRSGHAGSIHPRPRFRKPRRGRRGFALIEATMAMSLLSVVGLLLLKLSLNVLHPRQYALQQVLTDSYMSYERAVAERIPFESLLANDSPWPAYPEVAGEVVELGKMPGGMPVTGNVARTRIADTGNYPIDGGTGTVALNPAAMKIWRVQSVLRYEIGGRTYVKSRTLVRAQ
jgi:hypothetical protein